MVRKSLAGMNRTDERKSEYAYVSMGVRKEFDGDGKVVKQETWKWRRELAGDGRFYGRLIERDGKPLTAEEKAKQDAAIRKAMTEFRAMGEADHRKRREEARKRSSEADAWIQEFPEALEYKISGEEMVRGRAATVLEATPRPGYQPKNMRARIFEKLRARMWIDKQDHELVRADAEVFDTVSMGFGILGRVEKGTRFYVQRVKVAPDLWLAEEETMRFGVRVLLVKEIHREMSTRFSDFVHKSQLGAAANNSPPTPLRTVTP